METPDEELVSWPIVRESECDVRIGNWVNGTRNEVHEIPRRGCRSHDARLCLPFLLDFRYLTDYIRLPCSSLVRFI